MPLFLSRVSSLSSCSSTSSTVEKDQPLLFLTDPQLHQMTFGQNSFNGTHLQIHLPQWTLLGVRILNSLLRSRKRIVGLEIDNPTSSDVRHSAMREQNAILLHLFQAQAQCSTLKHIRLKFRTGYGLTDEALEPKTIQALADMMHCAQRLETLSLIHMAITDKVLLQLVHSPISKGYNRANRLTSLTLTYNRGISDAGAKAVADWLQQDTTLRHLDLSYNSIGNQGAKYLLDALQVNTSLKSLSLNGNNAIDKDGAAAIGDALPLIKGLAHLKLLVLDSSQFEFVKPLVDGMFWNRSIRRLDCYRVSELAIPTFCLQARLQYYMGDYHKGILLFRDVHYGPRADLWPYVLEGINRRCGTAASADVIFHYLMDNPELFQASSNGKDVLGSEQRTNKKRKIFSSKWKLGRR